LKLIIILLCLLLSGCKIEYKLEIENDNSYTENIDMLKYFKDNNYKEVDELGLVTYDLAKMLRNDAYAYLGRLGFTDYSIKDISANNYEGVRVNRSYDSHISFGYNLAIKQVYSDFSVTDDNGIITLEAKGYNPSEIESKYEMVGMDVHDTVFVVELPFKVIETNADVIDEDNNIYRWYIDKETTTKDLLLKYDVNDIYELNIKTIGTKINMTFVYIVLGILVLLFIGGCFYLYFKRLYENRNKF